MPSIRAGKVSIDYDLGQPQGQRVDSNGVRYDGKPLAQEFAFRQAATIGARLDLTVQPLVTECYDALEVLDAAVPRDSLAAMDAADRIHEVVVGGYWGRLIPANHNSEALEYTLWVIARCLDWEAGKPPGIRYVHKGNPYFLGAIAALRCRNVEVSMMLFEAGDLADTETYKRAGTSTAGAKFPGRTFLGLDPQPASLLGNDVVKLRSNLKGWLEDFNAKSGVPVAEELVETDLDSALFQRPDYTTEARQVLGYLLRMAVVDSEPVLRVVQGAGPLARRRQVEWLFGMLVAVERYVRAAAGPRFATGDYYQAVAAVSRLCWSGAAPAADPLTKRMNSVSRKFGHDLDLCLNYWGSTGPAIDFPGAPWFFRWLETGRFIRNSAAHALETHVAVGRRWADTEEPVRFALLSAIWLTLP